MTPPPHQSKALTPGALRRLRWKGEAAFRSLGYYFTLRWNDDELGGSACRILGGFRVPPDRAEFRSPPTPGLPPSYSLVQLGPSWGQRWRLLCNDVTMISGDDPAIPLRHLVWNVNSETVRQTGEWVLVHAGSLSTPDGHGLLLPAPSGSGKTTLATALALAGFRFLSDEAAVIDPVTGLVHPYPRAVDLKAGSHDLFPALQHLPVVDGNRFAVAGDLGEEPAPPCRPRYAVFPHYEPGAPTTFEPMRPAEVLMGLAEGWMNRHRWSIRGLPVLADVARSVQGWRLVSGDLDAAVAAIRSATG